MGRGLFISFEGGDGVGKTTQIKALAENLRILGYEVVESREPGGTIGAESLRTLVKDAKFAWDAHTETALIYAARKDHVEKIIKPALRANKIILCDRFHDSTLAYQGGGRGVDAEWIMKLHLHLLGDFIPDITFLLDLPPDQALQRRQSRNEHQADIFEQMGLAFHQKIYDYFHHLLALSPQRMIAILATQPIADIEQQILAYVKDYIAKLQHD